MNLDYFKAEKITDRVIGIRSLSNEIMYLIVGEKEALLIDTCVGIVGYKDFVENLINGKKLTVLISHGHIDHAPGASEFRGIADVYMNHEDLEFYRTQIAIEDRRGYVIAGCGPIGESITDEQFVKADPDFPFLDLKDGMEFDLGDITVKAIAAPGHTKGCMAFLVKEERILILGDACNNSTFLFDDICASVEVYQQNMKVLKEKTSGKYDKVFIMHHIIDGAVDTLEQAIELCDEILNGKSDRIPFEFMGHKAFIAKSCNERMERTDGKFTNIIYNPEHVR